MNWEALIGRVIAPFLLLTILFVFGVPVKWLIRKYLPEGRLKRLLFTRVGSSAGQSDYSRRR